MYKVIIGETGNENGHVIGTYKDYEKALKAAKRAVKIYNGDGWYVVKEVGR